MILYILFRQNKSSSPYQTVGCTPFSFVCHISNVGEDDGEGDGECSRHGDHGEVPPEGGAGARKDYFECLIKRLLITLNTLLQCVSLCDMSIRAARPTKGWVSSEGLERRWKRRWPTGRSACPTRPTEHQSAEQTWTTADPSHEEEARVLEVEKPQFITLWNLNNVLPSHPE